jgi:hypothetical protein
MPMAADDLSALPGGDLVQAGLREIAAGVEPAESLLVSVASRRLGAAGLTVPPPFPDPELRLYDLLERADPAGAYGQYNALLRRLVSFERALECVSP